MTAVTPTAAYTPRRLLLLATVALVAGAGAVLISRQFGHAPDWALLLGQGWVLKLHIAAALSALLLGVVQLIGVKGTAAHRMIGWSWVIAMATVAISSFFIRVMNPGSFSLIHLLSGWTLIALPMGIWHVRSGRVRAHGRTMAALFVGGLVIAGGFTFLPGRLMWAVFFG
ncbi:DUF2306 domain-containing protein [Brevundimonas goettingensis]|uniref:DUF2306 domain-containing protein n=1 Tax=Brevundimonas goettingensis TaxID=2774190 RepID=A0A975BZF5_9CAUL|nr:DUF2306 domain-containing protein [Brevundimonas goettingensis]QTC90733.1 DUF2306 domain-containing protein [Brevundimonas goettingensis]